MERTPITLRRVEEYAALAHRLLAMASLDRAYVSIDQNSGEPRVTLLGPDAGADLLAAGGAPDAWRLSMGGESCALRWVRLGCVSASQRSDDAALIASLAVPS